MTQYKVIEEYGRKSSIISGLNILESNLTEIIQVEDTTIQVQDTHESQVSTIPKLSVGCFEVNI